MAEAGGSVLVVTLRECKHVTLLIREMCLRNKAQSKAGRPSKASLETRMREGRTLATPGEVIQRGAMRTSS